MKNYIPSINESFDYKYKTWIFIRKILTSISPVIACKAIYYQKFGKHLNLNNPQTLNEKIIWLKLNRYNNNPLITQCADKYMVREYVKSKGLENILNELFGVWKKVAEINWEDLPNQFAMKCNHGSTYNIICGDKSSLDIDKTKKILKKWMREDRWRSNAEITYKNIPRRIICEKYLMGNRSFFPLDYKIYCFHGNAKYVLVRMADLIEAPKFFFFNRNWTLMRINKDSINAPKGFTLPKPDNLQEMFLDAEILAEPFPFVRVDLYSVDKKIVFGELTFTPSGGFDNNRLLETDLLFGSMINLTI